MGDSTLPNITVLLYGFHRKRIQELTCIGLDGLTRAGLEKVVRPTHVICSFSERAHFTLHWESKHFSAFSNNIKRNNGGMIKCLLTEKGRAGRKKYLAVGHGTTSSLRSVRTPWIQAKHFPVWPPTQSISAYYGCKEIVKTKLYLLMLYISLPSIFFLPWTPCVFACLSLSLFPWYPSRKTKS